MPVRATIAAFFCVVAWLPQGKSANSKKLDALRAEFGKLAQKHGTDMFAGASQTLSRIVKLEGPGESEQASRTLGFACINDEDYKCCATALMRVAKARSKLENGPDHTGLERLGRFCADMKAARIVDAMAWLRQAMIPLEPEFNTTDSWNMLQYRFYELNTRLFSKKDYPGGVSMNDKPPNHCSLYHPGLTPRAWHKSHWHVAAKGLEKNFDRIGPEMDAFLNNPSALAEMNTVGRTSCRQDALLVQKGDWRDVGLYKQGVQDRRLCWKYFPHTCAILERELPELSSCPWGIASISRLGPGSDTMTHTGNTNSILTMHLGIHTPRGAGMTVGKESRQPAWDRGKVTVFDDSFPHKVWHKGSAKEGHRTVLLLRFWHPDFTMPERREKQQKSSSLLPRWASTRRWDALNSSTAEARWQRLNRAFRGGVGIK